MSPLPQPKVDGKGVFYKLYFNIVLLFGMTELKAQIAWEENVSGFDLSNRKMNSLTGKPGLLGN